MKISNTSNDFINKDRGGHNKSIMAEMITKAWYLKYIHIYIYISCIYCHTKFFFSTVHKWVSEQVQFKVKCPPSWTSYQIPKIAGCASTGYARNVFPATKGAWRTCCGACRDHYLVVSFQFGGGENVPSNPGACATRNFTYLARGTLLSKLNEDEVRKQDEYENPMIFCIFFTYYCFILYQVISFPVISYIHIVT